MTSSEYELFEVMNLIKDICKSDGKLDKSSKEKACKLYIKMLEDKYRQHDVFIMKEKSLSKNYHFNLVSFKIDDVDTSTAPVRRCFANDHRGKRCCRTLGENEYMTCKAHSGCTQMHWVV